jgi:plasmid stability protein
MPALLIKNLPPEVHDWLKHEAQQHRRSMTQQVVVIFEERMKKFRPVRFGPRAKLRKPLTNNFVYAAIRDGRP